MTTTQNSKVTAELSNFASAINTAAGRCKGLRSGAHKLVEAMGVKEQFPRSDAQLWHRSLVRAARAGLVRTLRQGDTLWIVVAA